MPGINKTFISLLVAVVAFLGSSSPAPAWVSTPWLDARDHGGIVYFLYESPPAIERYDIASETWLSAIPLSEAPTAFTVDDDGLYVSFIGRISRLLLDGSGETLLKEIGDFDFIFTIGDFLYLIDNDFGERFMVNINKLTGSQLDQENTWNKVSGISVAAGMGKMFACCTAANHTNVLQRMLWDNGFIGPGSSFPGHGHYPSASRTWVFPGEALVADDAGIIYDTNDLAYVGSLGGSFDDLSFSGNSPVLLRSDLLVAYSSAFLETGSYALEHNSHKILVAGEDVYSFYSGSQSIEVEKVPLSHLEPDVPGQPVDPVGLPYVPDNIVVGRGDIAYLLSKNHRSVFRWSVPQRRYIDTIPLLGEPSFMAYSDETNRLYLAYPSGKITHIRLDTALTEEPLVNSPQAPCGLATAGSFIFVCDPIGVLVSHFTYDQDGALISQVDHNYRSEEYIWNAPESIMYFDGALISQVDHNYRSEEYIWNAPESIMYFSRTVIPPRDLLMETFLPGGVIGVTHDSPYPSIARIHPIRVSPDGSVVVLGSGAIHEAVGLGQINTLSNEITDAVWKNREFFSLSPMELIGDTQLQRWLVINTDYHFWDMRLINGTPLRLFGVREGLLVISFYNDAPLFTLRNTYLEEWRGHDLVIDFGPGTGIWANYDDDPKSWERIHNLTCESMTIGNLDGNSRDDVVLDFGDGVGVWANYNEGHLEQFQSTWRLVHGLSPQLLAAGDLDGSGKDDVVLDFGDGIGVWVKYSAPPASWRRLHPSSTELMEVADIDGNGQDDVIMDFGSATGVWVNYNDDPTSWRLLHPFSPELMAVGDLDGNRHDEVVFDFGSGVGVWSYNSLTPSNWRMIHGSSPELLVVGDLDDTGRDEVILDFGSGVGVWTYYSDNPPTWRRIHALSPEHIAVGDLDSTDGYEVILDFGPGTGIWANYNDDPAAWRMIHGNTANSIATGNFD